jgi:hypothetical protein
MTVLVRIICNACHGMAGVGLDLSHARFNVKETGGRIISGHVNVCSGCAKATV